MKDRFDEPFNKFSAFCGKTPQQNDVPGVILFYRQSDENGEWSNFAPYPVYLKGVIWRTSEHYFQAEKFAGANEAHREAIRLAPTPKEAAAMGRDRSHPCRAVWNRPVRPRRTKQNKLLLSDFQQLAGSPMLLKDYVMIEAVRAKIRQHPELRARLLDTGDAILVEHTENDSYWADGGDGSGKNMLGKILMLVRQEERRRAER